MNELEKTLEDMEKLYNQKLKKANSDTEIKYILDKISFIQNFRLVLWTNKNMDKFIENFRF